MKLNNLNRSCFLSIVINEERIAKEDQLFLECVLDEGVKDVAGKALQIGTNALKDLSARGVTMAPKVAKFFQTPYGRIALALAMNAVAAGVASGAVDDVMMNLGDTNDYDQAIDSMQDLTHSNEEIPGDWVDNLKGDGQLDADLGDTDTDVSEGGSDEGGGAEEGVLKAADVQVLKDKINTQKQELANLMRGQSRLGNTSSAASMSKLNNAVNYVIRADEVDTKGAALKAMRYVQGSYNLEEGDIANKLKDLMLNVVKLKMKTKS